MGDVEGVVDIDVAISVADDIVENVALEGVGGLHDEGV